MIKLFLLLFSSLNLYSLDITKCEIIKSSISLVNIEINSKISIRNIAYKKGTLFMPFEEYNGRQYYNIKILSKELYILLNKIFKEGRCESKQNKKELIYEISDIKKLNSKTRRANISVKIDRALNITAGIVQSKDRNFWISWPKDFVFLDKKEKEIIDKKILDYYNKNK